MDDDHIENSSITLKFAVPDSILGEGVVMRRVVVSLLILFLSLSLIPCFVIPVRAEPTLLDVLNTLGFINVAEANVSTFPAGVYNLTLYAEFAGYCDQNELSYYQVGTSDYVVVITGPEGGYEYIVPPLTKTLMIDYEFGLSMLSPGPHRYFSENNLNPDGQIHCKIYANLDDASMYFVGFENEYGEIADRDYQDMVFALDAQSPPQASFTYSPPHPKALEGVVFSATDSSPYGGIIVSYRWDFGDGNVTTIGDPVITHVYATFGTCNVTLVMANSFGLNGSISQMVNARAPPTASFIYSPNNPGTGEFVQFDASASTPNGGTITEYKWDFGDGNVTSLSVAVVTHRFMSHGTFNVTLTVFDSEELNATAWKTVTVTTHDVAVVEVEPESSWLYKGKLCHANVTVTVANNGDVAETFTLTVYADNDTAVIGDEYTIGNKLVSNLLPNEYRNFTFTWDTTAEVQPCHLYLITAKTSIIPHETHTQDNNMSSSVLVKVRIFCDVNADGEVDIEDIYLAALAFGASNEPGELKYNPAADVSNDDLVDIFDMYLIASNFGKSCKPQP
jgi:PKD repeat protein